MKKLFYTLLLGLAFSAFINAQSSDMEKTDAKVDIIANETKADNSDKDKECKTKNTFVEKKSCATKKSCANKKSCATKKSCANKKSCATKKSCANKKSCTTKRKK